MSTEVDAVITKRERFETWWALFKGRLVIARIPWLWVPKGEE